VCVKPVVLRISRYARSRSQLQQGSSPLPWRVTGESGLQRRAGSCSQVFVHFIHVAKCQAHVLLKTIDVGHSWIVPRGQRAHHLVVNNPIYCAVSIINHWDCNANRLKKDKIWMTGWSWLTFASSSKLGEKHFSARKYFIYIF